MTSHPLHSASPLCIKGFQSALFFWHDIGEVYMFQDRVFVDRSLFLFTLVKSIAMSAAEVDKKIRAPLNLAFRTDLARLKDTGELTRNALTQSLWSNTSLFPVGDHIKFITLLEKFDVLYSLSDDLWLVPALVPDRPVPAVLRADFDSLPEHYIRRITLPFAPFALIQRLHTSIERVFDIQMAVSWGFVAAKSDPSEAAFYRLESSVDVVFPETQFDFAMMGEHNTLYRDSAACVITVEASSRTVLRAVLWGMLRLGEFAVWVPLDGSITRRDGAGSVHVFVGDQSKSDRLHDSEYPSWRSEKLPLRPLLPAVAFADIERNVGRSLN